MILSWLEAERPRDLALARGLADWIDEIEDLLAGRQAGGGFAGHEAPNWAKRSPPTMRPGKPMFAPDDDQPLAIMIGAPTQIHGVAYENPGAEQWPRAGWCNPSA